MDRPDLFGVLVFGVIGAGLLTGAGYAAKGALARDRAQVEQADWPQIEATVVSVSESRGQDGDRRFHVTTEWAGPDGHTYQHEGWTSSLTATGTKHLVRVDPSDPAHLGSDASMDQWFVPGALGVMGFAFLGIAGRVTVARLRSRPSPG